jgi:hypothetical protein
MITERDAGIAHVIAQTKTALLRAVVSDTGGGAERAQTARDEKAEGDIFDRKGGDRNERHVESQSLRPPVSALRDPSRKRAQFCAAPAL